MSSSASDRWVWATVLLTVGSFGATIGLAPASGASPARGLTWLLFVGSSVHVAATGWLYTLGDVRAHALAHRPRYIWIPLGLVVLTALTAAVVPPARFVWLLLAYFAWQFVHFQKQNLGMAALAASSDRIPGLTLLERRVLMFAGVAGIAGLVAHPGLLQLQAPLGAGTGFPVAGGVFACAVAVGVTALGSRPRAARPPGFCAVYLSSLLFFAPVFACSSPYAAVGAMTVAHGLQYLLLVGLVAGGAGRGRSRIVAILMLVNVAILGGAALSAASHRHGAAPAGRLLFGAYLGAVMAHFVIDAGLWRLRDAFPRRFLASRVPYLVRPSSPRPIGSFGDRSAADIG